MHDLETEPKLASGHDRLTVDRVTVQLTDDHGRRFETGIPLSNVEQHVHAELGPLRMFAEWTWFPIRGRLRLAITIHNPRRARHRGGFWDLGDPGSVLLKDLSVQFSVSVVDTDGPDAEIGWMVQPDGEVHQTSGGWLEVYQESSGGERWNSRNHVNRNGIIPMRFRGYRTLTAEGAREGLRANPVVALCGGSAYAACTLEEFWQQFPSELAVRDNAMRVQFWPRQFPDLHELQAGEKNTRVVWLQFGDAETPPWTSLQDVHDATPPLVDRESLAASGAAPFLPPEDCSVREECQMLLDEALAGKRSFFAKREAIDEYGWRNFGDVWADHEEAYCEDPSPVISHYNNQYDLLYGLLIQYVLTGDVRWWQLAEPLARHILDIDIYHTDRDKPAYNGGLFWHTSHYLDAGRCTHRSYSVDMRGKSMLAPGGGPANEHNYATGLLLYHQLTGNERAREAVLGLADWVIGMDDGDRHIFGVLSSEPTGAASKTAMDDYHGPGRGAGNSINVLLDAWLASGDQRYLDKAGELIRRTIHPTDDLDARQLDDAELRWSYTVHLQALFRFLELTKDQTELDSLRSYVRTAVLHYAGWMAENESFYLDRPEELEFPTETWAAQELRKGNVLWMAALYAGPDDRPKLIERGREFLDGAWSRLMAFESRNFTRPLSLVLQQCYLEQYLANRLDRPAETSPSAPASHGKPRAFIPQRAAIRKRVRTLRGACRTFINALKPLRWGNAVRQLWIAERVRRLADHFGGKLSRR